MALYLHNTVLRVRDKALLCLSFQAPGAPASEIFAKLEVYLWLGLAKYSKEAITCLPEEFMPVYEEEEQKTQLALGQKKLPLSLSCQGESANLKMTSKLKHCHQLDVK